MSECWYQIYPPARSLAEIRTFAPFGPRIRAIASQAEDASSNTRGIAALARFLSCREQSAILSGDAQRVHEQLTQIAYLMEVS